MYMLRKLLLNIGDFPAQTSHILFNYLVSSLWANCAAQNLSSVFMCAIIALNFSLNSSYLLLFVGASHQVYTSLSGEEKEPFFLLNP